MSDTLTQLQDCYDQLLDRMYTALHHISTKHTFGEIPTQSNENYHSDINQARRARDRENRLTAIRKELEGRRTSLRNQGVNERVIDAQMSAREAEEIAKYDSEQVAKREQEGLEPEDPAAFERNLAKFSQDLMLKYTQIEEIIKRMPALGRSGEELEEEIKALELQVREKELEKEALRGERDGLVRKVEVAIEGLRRV